MYKNSYFREINNHKAYPKLEENINVDILIIGAGISGLHAAYELLPYSNDIVIVDQNHIYQNTTSSTTAKITYQHGYIYHDLIKKHGLENARLYKDFNELGLRRIEEIIEKEEIDCDFKLVDSYLFALKHHELANIENEEQAYKNLSIEYEKTNIHSNISKYQALKVKYQARFNVERYLNKLASILEEKGVRIYENTKIVEVNYKTKAFAKSVDNFTILANNIIICSHYPFYKNFNFYFIKMIPQMAYATIGKSDLEIEDANYINTDENNTYAIRYIEIEDKKHLLISGLTHDVNKFKDAFEIVNKLKAFGKEKLRITEYLYTWTGQDYASTDIMPYIGKIKTDIYVATAYYEWGMAASSAAAILLKDLIVRGKSRFSELFNPRRVKLTSKLLTYNAKMLPTLIKTRIFPQAKKWTLSANIGKVLKYKRMHLGMYKDEDGKVYFVKAICPHMKCGLRFNPIDKTYDCKCHGSRFKYTGKKIDGPAKYDLEQIDQSMLID